MPMDDTISDLERLKRKLKQGICKLIRGADYVEISW